MVPSLTDASRDAEPDAEIFMCLTNMGLLPDEDRLAMVTPALEPPSPGSTRAERAQTTIPSRTNAYSVCVVFSCLRGREHSLNGGETVPVHPTVNAFAATRGGTEYNPKLNIPDNMSHKELLPSQVSDEERRLTPPYGKAPVVAMAGYTRHQRNFPTVTHLWTSPWI